MEKMYLNESQVQDAILDIFRKVFFDNFKPELIVGLVRGGAIPATYLSHFLNVPCYLINKDDTFELPTNKRVLVIDDINDTGKALTEVNNMLYNYLGNIRYATLVNNQSSSFEVDYSSIDINKYETPDLWIVFPWETWWTSDKLT